MEIEKKYKLSAFPTDLPLLKKSVQEQGYLSVTPAVRIRRETGEDGVRYVLCVKGKGHASAGRSGSRSDKRKV